MKRDSWSATGALALFLQIAGLPGFPETSLADPARPQVPVEKWLESPPCDLGRGNCLEAPKSLPEGYAYAWKQFLFMVGEEDGAYRFTRFGDALELFPASGKPGAYPGGSGMTAGQTGKHLALADVRQAAALVPVVDRNGRWLHYSVLTNEPEWDYVKDHQLYRRTVYNEKGCAGSRSYENCLAGKVCVNLDGSDGCTKGPLNITLPWDSIELKVAWRVLETCDLPDSPASCEPEPTEGYVTVKSTVDPYGPGKLYGEVKNVTLGMVGMHILSKTKSTPDWIWTTFELRHNAPDCDWTFRDPHFNMFCLPSPLPLSAWAGQTKDPRLPYDRKSNPYLPAVAWELAEQGLAVLSRDRSALLCTSRPDNFKFAQPPLFQPTSDASLEPTSVCRENLVRPGVRRVNREVSNLLRKLGDKAAHLARFELVGAFWFRSDCREDPDCKAMGHTDLANTTMETFEQYLGHIPGRDQGCTVCHAANQFDPMPYDDPIAQGLADRSFVFQRIQQE